MATGAAPKLDFHPLANEFPLLDEDSPEFLALVEDIRANGLQEPIRLFEGKILDGRNRYRACLKTGKELRTEEPPMTYEQARDFSISKNLQRRHLTRSQQAMYLVRSGLLKKAPIDAAKRSYRTGDSAVRRIGQRYGVSHVSIYKALFVEEHDKKEAQRVLNGELSVAKAEKNIRDLAKKPPETVRNGKNHPIPRSLQNLFRAHRRIDKAWERMESMIDDLLLLVDNQPPKVRKSFARARRKLAEATEALGKSVDLALSLRPEITPENR